MSTITATPELAALLGQLKETTEIHDGDGQVLGVFSPQRQQARLKALFDLEEAERTLAAEFDAGRPLKEIWRDVQSQRANG